MFHSTQNDQIFRRPGTIRAVTAVGFAALLAVTGCSSNDDNSSGSTSASMTSASMTFGTGMTSPSGTGTAMPMTGASKDVNDAFVAFFSGETSGGQKILLVQNGEAFADTINAQAESPMAKGTTATVTNVDMDAPGHATVTYTIEMNGQPVLADRIGEAVEQDGQWKVAQGTFCDLLTLEGNPPPVCGQPTTSAATPS